MKAAMDRAIDEGADPELVEKMGYGKTAIEATMKFSDVGPVVAVSYTHLDDCLNTSILERRKYCSYYSVTSIRSTRS